MKKIGIIGHFYLDNGQVCGQTVKTQMLFKGLKEFCSDEFELITVETERIRSAPVSFLFSLFRCLIQTRTLVVLLSKKGRKVIFPVLYYWSKITKGKVFHYAIGGRIAEEAAENKKMAKYLSSFEENWMEAQSLADGLKELGIHNAIYVPNMKKIAECSETEKLPDPEVLHCCTFSRVHENKGIGDAIDAVARINEASDRVLVDLHVFGAVYKEYEEKFSALCQEYSDFVTYGGLVPTEESTKTISRFDLLLFPTKHKGEGIPGTVIDAFAAGVPVLAREWAYGKEMISHGENGFMYDQNSPEHLKDWLEYCILHKDRLSEMKDACRKSADPYRCENVIPVIKEKLNKM